MATRGVVRGQKAANRRLGRRSYYINLLRRIETRTAQIAVIGLGHVGLPTAVLFADAGYRVFGVDARGDLARAVASGKVRSDEPGLEDLLVRALRGGNLRVTTDVAAAAKQADVVIVCVQTPVTKSGRPDLGYLRRACRMLASNLSRGRLVVIESTVPPGTTGNMVARILEKRSGLKSGIDFWLAHCPERMAPGKAVSEFTGTARLVGGIDGLSSEAAVELFKRVTKSELIVTRAAEAEVAKVAENTFRAVNIAFANELALLCEGLGLDVAEIVRLANSHPRVSIHHPGPGVGGPCIPKDPSLLIYAGRRSGLSLKVVLAARFVNSQMPRHVSRLIHRALRHVGKRNGRPKVSILGAAYKAGVSSAQHSPSEQVIKEIMKWGVDVVVYDPYCDETFGARPASSLTEAVRGSDCVVIMTDHDEFKRVDPSTLKDLMNARASIVDARRILDPSQVNSSGTSYFGLGLGYGSHTGHILPESKVQKDQKSP